MNEYVNDISSYGVVNYIFKLLSQINFMVTPCISNIQHFNIQLMHTTLKK